MKRAPLPSPDCVVSGRSRASQPDQIVRNVAELANDLGVPESPVAGSPERLKATAPTMRGLRESASAFMTAEFEAFDGPRPAATPSSAATKGKAT